MDFEFPPDTLMLRDMLRRFVQNEAQPLEMKYFNTGELEPEERDRLRKGVEQLGLWGLTLPEEFGGGGLDNVTACLIEEELGKTFIPLDLGEVTPLLFACRDDQVTRYLEPALAGDRRAFIAAREPESLRPQDWKTFAKINAAEIVVIGQKTLTAIPGADDFFILFAHTFPKPEVGDLTAFIFDSNLPGVKVTKNGVPTLILNDLHLGEDDILGEPGGALRIAAEEAPHAWIRTGARYVGLAERMLTMAVEHAKDWVSFGEPLAVRPAIQCILDELQVEVESTRWLVYHAAWLADKDGDGSIRVQAAKVRLASGEMLQHCVDTVTMVFAGPGPSPAIEPHRMVYSAIPPEALDMALEQARMAVAADLLDLKPERSDS